MDGVGGKALISIRQNRSGPEILFDEKTQAGFGREIRSGGYWIWAEMFGRIVAR